MRHTVKHAKSLENAPTIYKALKHQIIETIEYNYITELWNKYTGFTRVNTIYLSLHLIDRYGKIKEMDLKDNQKRFNEALNTIIPIEKYFEIFDDCIKYLDYGKQKYTVAQIINNVYNTVLAMLLYTEPINMCYKKLLSEKTLSDFKKFFAEYYHDLHKLQRINATQAVFMGPTCTSQCRTRLMIHWKNW